MLWTLITMTEPFFAFRPLQKERSPLREEKEPLRMEVVLKHLREILGEARISILLLRRFNNITSVANLLSGRQSPSIFSPEEKTFHEPGVFDAIGV